MSKYKIGDRIRFKGEKHIHKIMDYNALENNYTTLLEGVGATVIIPDYQIEHTELVQSYEGEVEQVNNSKGKYKLIDILNMISKGELNFGTQFRYKGDVYVYKRSCILSKENANLIQIFGYDSLNDEVELIEPDHFTDDGKMAEKIEELNYKLEELDIPTYNESWLMNCIKANRDKLNEVINKVNAQTTVLLAQEKEIKELKEQLDY